MTTFDTKRAKRRYAEFFFIDFMSVTKPFPYLQTRQIHASRHKMTVGVAIAFACNQMKYWMDAVCAMRISNGQRLRESCLFSFHGAVQYQTG